MNASKETSGQFSKALKALVRAVREAGRTDSLVAIGVVTADAVQAVGASLLFAGDLPEDAPAYQRLSPVEWPQSHEDAFVELNQHLKANHPLGGESDQEYKSRVSIVFDACATAMELLDLRREFPRLAFLTFAGVDPNPALEEAEAEFVRRMNPPDVFDEWRAEFG